MVTLVRRLLEPLSTGRKAKIGLSPSYFTSILICHRRPSWETIISFPGTPSTKESLHRRSLYMEELRKASMKMIPLHLKFSEALPQKESLSGLDMIF